MSIKCCYRLWVVPLVCLIVEMHLERSILCLNGRSNARNAVNTRAYLQSPHGVFEFESFAFQHVQSRLEPGDLVDEVLQQNTSSPRPIDHRVERALFCCYSCEAMQANVDNQLNAVNGTNSVVVVGLADGRMFLAFSYLSASARLCACNLAHASMCTRAATSTFDSVMQASALSDARMTGVRNASDVCLTRALRT